MLYENKITRQEFPYRSAIMKNDHGFINHCHKEIEILVVLQGELFTLNETESFHLKKNDVIVFMPFENHEILKGPNYNERLCVQFDIEQVAPGIKDTHEYLHITKSLNSIETYSARWDNQTKKKITELVHLMHREYKQQEIGWQFAIQGLINSFIPVSLREMPRRLNKRNIKNKEKMKKVLQYISKHYTTDITLKSCADELGFNSTYFSRYFKQHMAISFQEYVKNLRIEKAKWLLITEDLTITEICFQAGFNDIKTFNKHFLALCGKNPTHFRRDSQVWLESDN